MNDSTFNTVHWIDELVSKLIRQQWIDNNVVLLVTNCVGAPATVERNRERPRITQINKSHVQRVFGNSLRALIAIPETDDHYNHKMLSCDKVDQLIAYHRPNIRCVRT